MFNILCVVIVTFTVGVILTKTTLDKNKIYKSVKKKNLKFADYEECYIVYL